MTKNNNLILGENKEKAYTLLARLNSKGNVHEYVVAWCYDKENDTWQQGHYYKSINDAMDFMYSSEIITWVVNCMKYINDVLPEDTQFMWIEENELKALVVDGLYQD